MIITKMLLTAALLAAFAAAQLPAAATDGGNAGEHSLQVSVLAAPESQLSAQIDAWIAELSKEKAFSDWAEATWSKSPLGPGTHGWLVTIRGAKSGETLGYLIVAAKPEGGFALVEYGAGEMVPFSAEVLGMALESDGLEGIVFSSAAVAEPRYYDPAHMFWVVKEGAVTRVADALTGAWLPVEEADIAKLQPIDAALSKGNTTPLPGKRLHISWDAADPYMDLSWIDAADARVKDWDSFIKWSASGDAAGVYVAGPFGGKLPNPIGVSGYHWWTDYDGADQQFAALSQDGLTRYVPLPLLISAGTFR